MGPSPWDSENPMEEVVEKFQRSEGMEDTRRTRSLGSIKQGSHGLTESESVSTGPAWVCTRSSLRMLKLSA